MQLLATFVVLWDVLQSSPGTSTFLLLAISDPPRLPLGAGRSHCAQFPAIIVPSLPLFAMTHLPPNLGGRHSTYRVGVHTLAVTRWE